MLRQNDNVFFLHLLGMKQMVMQKRPHSIEYNNNIRVVDNIVRENTEKISQRYKNDNKTAFYLRPLND